MIEHPSYLYGSYEMPSPNDGALFHYTKFESFLKIVETMTLRSSPLHKMNDLNEINIDSLDWNSQFLLMFDAEKYVKEQCSVISFTRNYMTGPLCQEGTNHPAMWAHYADNSNGLCLVLDKKELMNANKERLKGYFSRMGQIMYRHHCEPKDEIVNSSYTNVSEFVHKNYRELFFIKHKDWKYENEERFFIESPEFYLNIKGAIKYVVIGARLKQDENRLLQLVDLMVTPTTMCYKYFTPHSFAEMCPGPYGYLTSGVTPCLDMILRKMSRLSNEYCEWLRREFRMTL